MVRAGCAACGGIGTPDEVMTVVCNHTDEQQGIACHETENGDELYVKIDPACFAFDAQGRITCLVDPPSPGACAGTVAGLGEFIVMGTGGGSTLTHAYGSPQALDWCMDNTIDVASSYSWALAGGQNAAWGIYNGNTEVGFYTDVDATTDGWDVSSISWQNLNSDAGIKTWPTGRNSGANPFFLETDGGWYGYLVPQYNPMTVDKAIRHVAGRMVLAFRTNGINPNGGAPADVTAIISSIQATCAQDSAMVILPGTTTGLGQAERVNNTGATAVIYAADFTSPAEITGSGATWCIVPYVFTDEVIATYIAAGLNTIVATNSRHYATTRAMGLGARGIICDDPVYARGPVNPPLTLAYRSVAMPTAQRGTNVGHLTAYTDTEANTLDQLDTRGYSKQTESGKFFWATGTTRDLWTETIGEWGPLPVADLSNWSATWQFQLDKTSLPSNSGGLGPRGGLVICSQTDYDTRGPDPTQRSGYYLTCPVGTPGTGRMRIGRYNADGTSTEIADLGANATVPLNDRMTFTVTVTPTTITFQRTDLARTITATDSTWRGAYCFLDSGKAGGDEDFNSGYHNVRLVSGVVGVVGGGPE